MIELGSKVNVKFPSGQIVNNVEVVGIDYLDTWIIVDLGGRHDQVKISWLFGETRGVRCGNHGDVAHHCSSAEVKACYASHFSEKRIRENASEKCGWWDLPIAGWAWSGDATVIER